ncbi:DedA family protein [bacterium]|nr:DedA family protein [bacterium]
MSLLFVSMVAEGLVESLSSHFEEWGAMGLLIWAFCEAIFFPLPPDLGLLFLAGKSPQEYAFLAGVATVGSATGALVGWWLGRFLEKPIVARFGEKKVFQTVKRKLLRHGDEAILLAGFTPVPYKFFCVISGMMGLKKRTLFIFSLLGRGARFFLVAHLAARFGEEAKGFWKTPAGIAWMVGVVLLILSVGFFREWRSRRHSTPIGEDDEGE